MRHRIHAAAALFPWYYQDASQIHGHGKPSLVQVPDEAKAALRYATGAASTLQAAAEKKSNAADAALWRGLAAVVAAELDTLGGVGTLHLHCGTQHVGYAARFAENYQAAALLAALQALDA